jgi:hypothetical protein
MAPASALLASPASALGIEGDGVKVIDYAKVTLLQEVDLTFVIGCSSN